MDSPHFLRIEREGRDGSRHYVIHTHDPKFSMELMPDGSAPDKIGKGVMKRICVPNSWAGDYTRYAKFMSAAQEFFGKSFAPPVPTRRVVLAWRRTFTRYEAIAALRNAIYACELRGVKRLTG